MPKQLDILYNQDLDINGHYDTLPLEFILQRGNSFVDAKVKHLQLKCVDVENESIFEVYDFNNDDLEDIKQGNCKIAHNFPLLDDSFGKCVRIWCENNVKLARRLEIICGVTRGGNYSFLVWNSHFYSCRRWIVCYLQFTSCWSPKNLVFCSLKSRFSIQGYLKQKKWLDNSLRKKCYLQPLVASVVGSKFS